MLSTIFLVVFYASYVMFQHRFSNLLQFHHSNIKKKIMKKTLLLLSLLYAFGYLSLTPATAQNRAEYASNIEKVMVFKKGAQVTRRAQVNIGAGKSELVFKGISPKINKQSIQVNAAANFTILSVVHQMNYLQAQAKRQEIEQLKVQEKQLLDRLLIEKSMLNVYKNEETILNKNQQIGGENSGLKTLDLREALDFQRNRMTEVLLKQIEINKNIALIDEELKKVQAQLKALNEASDLSTSEIVITVMADSPINTSLELSYLVEQASWQIMYDIRVKDINSPLQISYKANVRQQSGEDWREVKLALSTGNPFEGGQMPTLDTWWLEELHTFKSKRKANGYGYIDDLEEQESSLDQDRKQQQSPYSTGASSSDIVLERKEDKIQQVEIVENFQSTSITFDIATPYTVLNDGKNYMVDIKQMEAKANYQYIVIPKLDADAFLNAQITDWDELNLLDGEVNLFLEGAFLGKSYLAVSEASDTLNISLGRDKSIVVSRTKLKDLVKKQAIGGSQIETRAWEISVRNNKKQAIDIIIKDQYPISRSANVVVERISHDKAILDETTGILEWRLKIAPAREEKVTFKYSVKYPKDNPVMIE